MLLDTVQQHQYISPKTTYVTSSDSDDAFGGPDHESVNNQIKQNNFIQQNKSGKNQKFVKNNSSQKKSNNHVVQKTNYIQKKKSPVKKQFNYSNISNLNYGAGYDPDYSYTKKELLKEAKKVKDIHDMQKVLESSSPNKKKWGTGNFSPKVVSQFALQDNLQNVPGKQSFKFNTQNFKNVILGKN